MKYLVLILLSIAAVAQTQGNAPTVVDSFLDGSRMNGGTGSCAGIGNCVNFVDGENAQDLIVCGSEQFDATGGACTGANPPWTFSDNQGFTWTANTSANAPVSGFFMQTAYACTTSSNSTYTVSRSNAGNCTTAMTCMRISHACSGGSITKDAFTSNVNSISASGITTLTNSVTTTKLNDLIVSFASQALGNGGGNRISPIGALNFIAGDSTGFPNAALQISPSIGANNYQWSETNATFRDDAEQTIAFSLPITEGDSAMPKAQQGVAYSATLHCYGGTSSTPTFALASGAPPTGLTLHTATGVIDGTPTVLGTTAATYTCTDGTNTSAAQSLPITVGATASVTQIGSALTGTLNGGNPATFNLTTAACGDIFTLFAVGADTHFGAGYVQGIFGPNQQVSSSDGALVQKFQLNSGDWVSPLMMWVVGPFLGSSPTVTIKNATSSTSALFYFGKVLRGADSVLDQPVVNNVVVNSASVNLTANYTTVVANEYLQMAAISTQNGTNTYTFSAPLSLDNTNASGISGAAASALIATPQTVAATVNDASTAGTCGSFTACAYLSGIVTAIRSASIPAVCASFSGAGEKHRRTGGN